MNKDILEQAITKAIANGWQPMAEQGAGYEVTECDDIKYYFGDDHGSYSTNDIIWNHEFAKALWGDTDYTGNKCEHCDLVSSFQDMWKHHLQQMVIADDPIKYLGENI